MSCFIDLALKRTSVVNVISRATGGSRDDACVLSQVDEWLVFGEPVTSYLLYNGSASSSV